MTFRDWQQLTPDEAARELHARVRARFSAAQRRAVLASLRDEPALAKRFAESARHGPLGGVPFLLKDLFDVAGEPTFAGSSFLPEVRPPGARDAAVVQALRGAGAVYAGKTHLHEFAYGITGENPHYGDVEHPRFPGRTSGGSSSGSAAAVAAGIVPLAIGTDTGGSIRVPAAFCGVFGFRLQPGDAFVADAFPLAPSFDTAGWFTATAADMRLALDALVGPSADAPSPRGIYLELPEIDSDVAAACRAAAMARAGEPDAETRETLLRGFAPALEAYQAVVAHEAWRRHAPWAERFRERYDPAVRQRLESGRSQTRDRFERALAAVTAVRLLWAKIFLAFDFLVLPATPCGALTKAECTRENRRRLLALNAPASLGGLPVLTVPVPLPSGLTAGLQIVVPHPLSPAIRWALGRPA